MFILWMIFFVMAMWLSVVVGIAIALVILYIMYPNTDYSAGDRKSESEKYFIREGKQMTVTIYTSHG